MPESQPVAERNSGEGLLVLGVDTCGSSGTAALARIQDGKLSILEQKDLAGRTYSALLVATIAEILDKSGLKLADLGAIVVVNGPGSFSGVRVGLSAVKGLAEPGQIPVVAVSRLEVLAAKARVKTAALDAHRHEVFLRISEPDGTARELLAGAEEVSHISDARCGAPMIVAVSDDAAVEMVGTAWVGVELRRVEAPTAVDAIRLCVPAILAGEFADLALLDGHYLRRSDAEIFGDQPRKTAPSGRAIHVRRMRHEDLDVVTELARVTHHAPAWPRQAYEKALDPVARPSRVALVAEDAQIGAIVGFVVANVVVAEAELESIVTASPHQRRGVARELFSSLKKELRHPGAREVILEVRAGNNAARGFYRFLGFTEEGVRSGYYADPVEDAVLMRLQIC